MALPMVVTRNRAEIKAVGNPADKTVQDEWLQLTCDFVNDINGRLKAHAEWHWAAGVMLLINIAGLTGEAAGVLDTYWDAVTDLANKYPDYIIAKGRF